MTAMGEWFVLSFEIKLLTFAAIKSKKTHLKTGEKSFLPSLSVLYYKNRRMKKMIRFNCDYNEGAHPRILETLVKTNMEQTPGYGEDPYCEKAAKVIKNLCKKGRCSSAFSCGRHTGKSDGNFINSSPVSGSALCGRRSYQCA